jgi:hypothetical protein
LHQEKQGQEALGIRIAPQCLYAGGDDQRSTRLAATQTLIRCNHGCLALLVQREK